MSEPRSRHVIPARTRHEKSVPTKHDGGPSKHELARPLASRPTNPTHIYRVQTLISITHLPSIPAAAAEPLPSSRTPAVAPSRRPSSSGHGLQPTALPGIRSRQLDIRALPPADLPDVVPSRMWPSRRSWETRTRRRRARSGGRMQSGDELASSASAVKRGGARP